MESATQLTRPWWRWPVTPCPRGLVATNSPPQVPRSRVALYMFNVYRPGDPSATQMVSRGDGRMAVGWGIGGVGPHRRISHFPFGHAPNFTPACGRQSRVFCPPHVGGHAHLASRRQAVQITCPAPRMFGRSARVLVCGRRGRSRALDRWREHAADDSSALDPT